MIYNNKYDWGFLHSTSLQLRCNCQPIVPLPARLCHFERFVTGMRVGLSEGLALVLSIIKLRNLKQNVTWKFLYILMHFGNFSSSILRRWLMALRKVGGIGWAAAIVIPACTMHLPCRIASLWGQTTGFSTFHSLMNALIWAPLIAIESVTWCLWRNNPHTDRVRSPAHLSLGGDSGLLVVCLCRRIWSLDVGNQTQACSLQPASCVCIMKPELLTPHYRIYTVSQKTSTFYFSNNSVEN